MQNILEWRYGKIHSVCLRRIPGQNHGINYQVFLQGTPQRNLKASRGKKPGINLEPESEGRNKAVIPWLEEEGFSKLCFAINVANTVAHLPQVTCMAYGTEHQAGVPALPLIAATPWESHLIALSSNSFMWNVIIGALFSS